MYKKKFWVLALMLIGVFLLYPRHELVILNHENNQLLHSIKVKPGHTLIVKFINSYELEPVWEYYQIRDDGSFILEQLDFKVFSYDAREFTYPRGFCIEEGMGRIKNIAQNYKVVIPEFAIRVPYTVPQWIIYENKEILLSDLAQKGTLLKIRVSRQSYCHIILREVLGWRQ